MSHDAVSMASDASKLDGLASTTMSQFTGDGYMLDWDDVRMIANSREDVDIPYMVDTYAETVRSFVIMPVSAKMVNHFAIRRAKV